MKFQSLFEDSYNFLWPMPLFLFSTHKQCLLSHLGNTQQHYYVSLKTLYPGGIRTRVFTFLRRMRCPLRHAARASYNFFGQNGVSQNEL
jgi:hypothetical protein